MYFDAPTIAGWNAFEVEQDDLAHLTATLDGLVHRGILTASGEPGVIEYRFTKAGSAAFLAGIDLPAEELRDAFQDLGSADIVAARAALAAGVHPATTVPYATSARVIHPLSFLAATALANTWEPSPDFRQAQSQLLGALLDAGADANVAVTDLLMLGIDASDDHDRDEMRRILQAQHRLGLELAKRARNAVITPTSVAEREVDQ